MRMVRELDAGPIIHQATTPIQDDETYGELQLRLSELGAMALIEALTLMSVGAATETEQDSARATFAPKITREMARIDWSRSGTEVARMIRAYDPKPSAYTTLAGADVKVFGARAVANSSDAEPGTVLLTSDTLVVACGDGAVSISDVQPSGKTRMRASDWSRGRGVREGDRFGS
jgi:methionyl-tRNA formyltransferase